MADSHADTIRYAAEFIAFSRAWVQRPEDATPRRLRAALEDALAFIERQAEVGERDRRQIARLTEALELICTLGLFDKGNGLVEAKRIARAVLAGEEDAE